MKDRKKRIRSGTSCNHGAHSKKPKLQVRATCRLSSQIHLVGYKSKQYPVDLAVSKKLEGSSTLPPALQSDDLESLTSSWEAFLWSTAIIIENRADPFFIVEEVKFLRELAGTRGAYHYTRGRMLNSRYESAFWTAAAAGYEQELGMALFEERAAKTAQRGYAVMPGFEIFVRALDYDLQSLDYPEALPGKWLGDFPQLMHYTASGEDKLQAEDDQAL